jgi:diguanylate cyclase (GGDEF)-like protein
MARVLIVDGSADTTAELRAAIGGEGYEISHVAWGVDPLTETADRPPDLVLISVAPLCDDPWRLVARLSSSASLEHVPVVVAGRRSDETLLLACLSAGAADCIQLPAHPQVVRSRVAAFVRVHLDRHSHDEMTRMLEQRARALENTVDALRESDRVLQDAQRRQRYLATHDALTGLPNRVLFHEFAQKTLAYARRHHQTLAIISLDLDRFHGINDHLGHAVGDQLLERVGQLINSCVRRSDMAARLSGDEFAILLVNLTSRTDASLVADKLQAMISQPHQIGGNELFVTPSMGVAVFPEDGETPETLLNHAGMALKLVKEQGRGMYKFYSPHMEGQSFERMKLEHHLREAIDRDELLLHYQPQIDVSKGEMIGCEALVRWRHPELGMIAPGEFIPIAESAGLIGRIGEWVIREACRQKRAWEANGLGGFPISVNVSFRQLKAGNLDEIVARILRDTGLDPSHLDLEITENSIMDDLDTALTSLNRLERMGVNISIDDFGTGYSSLSVLGKFPAHTLKIDQAFVRDIEVDGTNAAITRAVIAIAQELGLDTLAEGVETESQLEFLGRLGVVRMQGYLFDRPLPADEFEASWGDPESVHRLRR